MKKVLCYGDSNTWGYMPNTGGRYPESVRWPAVLQSLLGSEYQIIEAGLSGRTTIWDDPWDPYLNGRNMLIPEMRTHAPLDLVILMLGTNDLKWHSAWVSTQSAWTLVDMIQSSAALFSGGKPHVLWLAPPLVRDPHCCLMADPASPCTEAESAKFGGYYAEYAKFGNVPWLDISQIANPVPDGTAIEGVVGDGIHLHPSAHRALAEAVARKIQTMKI